MFAPKCLALVSRLNPFLLTDSDITSLHTGMTWLRPFAPASAWSTHATQSAWQVQAGNLCALRLW